MPFATSAGARLWFEVHDAVGSAARPPVVLVHGWGASTATNWVEPGWVTDLTSWGHAVVGLDVAGHGRSDKPHDRARYGYARLAGDVLAVCDHLGLDRVIVLGYSLGAFAGVHLLGHHPERLAGAVLIGVGDETEASASLAPRIAAALRAPDAQDIDDPIGRAYRAFVDADQANDREALALAALEMWPQGHPLDLGGPGLATAALPVLVLNGADDRPYVESDDRLAAVLPQGRLVRIAGCDHLAGVHDPRFRAEVRAFLADVA